MKKAIKPRPIIRKKNNPLYKDILQKDESLQKQYVLTADIFQNEALMKEIFQGCSDVVYRHIKIFGDIDALLVYIDGLVDTKLLDSAVLRPLMTEQEHDKDNKLASIHKILSEQTLTAGQVKAYSSASEVIKGILGGNTGIFMDGESNVLLAGIGGGEKRSISEPVTETVIRGPREGFTEDIRTNISLVRKRLRTPRLKMESYTIGEITQTNVIIAYIEGVAKGQVVEEVKKRVSEIKIDAVLESGYIEEFIEDEPYTLFPIVQNTERPDVIASNLLEGKVAIFTDGTPFVLSVPLVFWSELQSNEDYYNHFTMGTFLRWIRLIFLFIALLGPALYVAVTTFHQQMIPANLLMSIVDAREPTPFPAFVEALIMEITFEALREAGIRLPKPVGQAVSIVGALVIGQAAVSAGIVSAPMVIVVSLTGISSFTIPRYDFAFAVRVLRFPMIIAAGTLGLYGVTLGVLALLIHLVSLRSFGIPYFSPAAPLNLKGLRDVFIRSPWWQMHSRPELTTGHNNIRVPADQEPTPEQGKDDTNSTNKSQ